MPVAAAGAGESMAVTALTGLRVPKQAQARSLRPARHNRRNPRARGSPMGRRARPGPDAGEGTAGAVRRGSEIFRRHTPCRLLTPLVISGFVAGVAQR
jgi:hypothetical protein